MFQIQNSWTENENKMNISQSNISMIHEAQDPDTSVVTVANDIESLLQESNENFDCSNRSGLLSMDDDDFSHSDKKLRDQMRTQASENIASLKTGALSLQDSIGSDFSQNQSFLSKISYPQRPKFLNSIFGSRSPLQEIGLQRNSRYGPVPSLYSRKTNIDFRKKKRKQRRKMKEGFPALSRLGFDYRAFDKEKEINAGMVEVAKNLLQMCKSLKSTFRRVKSSGRSVRSMKKFSFGNEFESASFEVKCHKDRMREVYGIELDVY